MADNYTETQNEKTSAERKAAKDIGISGLPADIRKTETLKPKVFPKAQT